MSSSKLLFNGQGHPIKDRGHLLSCIKGNPNYQIVHSIHLLLIETEMHELVAM